MQQMKWNRAIAVDVLFYWSMTDITPASPDVLARAAVPLALAY
jgi:hypothetical protein